IEKIYEEVPEMAVHQAVAGFPVVTDGNAILRLKDWSERTRSQQEIAASLQPEFAALPGVRAFPTNPPSLGQSSRSSPVEFVIMSQVSYQELSGIVDNFLAELAKYPGVQNV